VSSGSRKTMGSSGPRKNKTRWWMLSIQTTLINVLSICKKAIVRGGILPGKGAIGSALIIVATGRRQSNTF
jgi:hypothetical protein